MSTAVSSHSGAGPLSLMSCVRESSPPQDGVSEYEVEKNASSKKKFWNPRKWFKRKSNKVSEEVISPSDVLEPKETLRSRSTSELSVSEEQTRRRSGTPMHPGLSVSHDSVFHSPHSGSELDLEAAQSSSSLSISHQPTQQDIRLQTELSERLRLRRTRGDTSEDDEGLPHSPCNSPTTTEGLLDKSNNKDHPTKSHSTCSDGSLLSMGSSEMDEDSFGLQSRHSSKLSLHDKRSQEPSNESETEWGPSHSSAPLNHSAAHHKVSIRPKRTHGAPRRKRAPVSVTPLPTTPEVNEDSSIRSVTPESTRETITELYTSMSHRQQTQTVTDPKIKCSSLPPGLAGPGADGNKLSRSRSNAGSKSQDPFSALEEEDSSEGKKSESSFFGRIFPRRSGKKKKKEEKEKEKTVVNNSSSSYAKVESYSSININYEPFDKSMIAVDNNLAIRPNALRSGPASRQRMQPIDIPASPDLNRQMETQPSSPLTAELESHFKNRKVINSSSPSSSSPLHFSISPPKSPWNEKRQYTKYSSKYLESREDSKSKIRIAGLSSLQQRVLSLNDDTDNSFKSLTNLPTDYEKPARPIAKSHSFKSTKTNYEQKDARYTYTAVHDEIKTEKLIEIDKKDTNIFKSISLDSVKNIDDIVESINEAKVVESEEYLTTNNMNFEEDNSVTISGPSHKAIVNIGSSDHVLVKNVESEFTMKEQQISVTKIQVKRESHQVTVGKNSSPEQIGPKNSIPEFFSVHLNKIEPTPPNPVSITSPKLEESQKVFNFEEREVAVEKQRKFSNDNIEVVKKEDLEIPPKPNTLVTVTPMAPVNNRYYKKHSESMKKPTVASEKPMLKIKSNSFEAVEPKKSSDSSPSSNKSSQSSLDKIENTENIVLRRKSLIRQKPDEEPELMKVFARRSLKLKDSESEALSQQVILMVQENENSNKSRDSDKENLSDSSPLEERKKSLKPAKDPLTSKDRTKDLKSKEPLTTKDTQKTALTETKFVRDTQKLKEPLAETKAFKETQIPKEFETKFVESTEVTLRKPVINNKFSLYQRTVSLTAPKTESKILKSISVVDRPKTESWFSKNQDDGKDENGSDEIITNLTEKSDIMHEFNVKPKNFNQRKAEWEKRAQEALRKTVP